MSSLETVRAEIYTFGPDVVIIIQVHARRFLAKQLRVPALPLPQIKEKNCSHKSVLFLQYAA